MEKLCTVSKKKKIRPGDDCGSDHELLIVIFRLKLKKVGKTTRPFRYDLNQIPFDYRVDVRNRFKGLDLIDGVPDELWTEVHDIVQETGIKTILMEKIRKRAKWLSGEALQIAVKSREAKSKGEKKRYTHVNAEFQRIARRDKKAFFSDQCKEIEENNRMEKTRDLFRTIRDTKGTFHAKSILESESHSVVSNSLQPHGLYSPWNSLGQNTGVDSHSFLQGIFPTQGSNPDLPHCRQILLPVEPPGKPISCKFGYNKGQKRYGSNRSRRY